MADGGAAYGTGRAGYVIDRGDLKSDEAALRREAGIVECFGEMESLAAHGRAGTIRVK